MPDTAAAPDPDQVLAAALQALMDRDIPSALALTAWLAQTCPNSPQAGYLRAAALLAGEDAEAGEAAMDQARIAHSLALMENEQVDIARMSRDGPYALAVSRKFYNRYWMGPAVVAAGCSVTAPAADVFQSLLLLAQALHYQGRPEEALRAFRATLQEKPAPYLHCFVLYCLLFVKDGMRRQAEEAQRWHERWGAQYLATEPTYHVRRSADRRLRIAYQGPFLGKQVRHFLPPLLDNHDRSQFEVFLYVEDAEKEPAVKDATVKSYGRLPYREHAEMIRDDRIDVLVDFHGHASGARPVVMARKPAPVQVSWLNWIPTTGLRAIDYTIHAEQLRASADEAALFAETIWNVGPVLNPFRPDPHVRATPAPATERGYVTFGSFNHPAKINDAVIAAWARILRGVPTARLHLKYSSYVDPILQMETMARFMAHGASPDALEFSGHETGEAYEAAFAHIDVHLDSSPCPGGTTSMEALSRSVPVLTLRGETFYARIGVEAAMAIGMPELIAESWDDYVAKAVALASDIPAVAALRARTRPALDASIYRDEAAVTRMFETAYRGMFEAWLARDLAKAA